MSTVGNVAVREAPAAEAVRRRINFIEGANVTLTIADDPVNHEVDVTIASAGAAASAWTKQFYPATNPDSNYGTYATVRMPNDIDTIVRQTIMIPEDIVNLEFAYIIVIPEADGNIRRRVDTNFAQVCVDLYQANVDVIVAGQIAVTQNQMTCLDFPLALTGVAGDDVVGVEFLREASDALDTVEATVHYVGILITGTL